MTLLELETSNSGQVIKDIVAALASDLTIPEEDRTTFNRLNTDYGKTLDETLVTLYGTRDIRKTVLVTYFDEPFWKINIRAYLKRHAALFAHCFEYIDAEYDPIENYAGTENESVTNVHGARSESDSKTIGSQSNSTSHGARSGSDNRTRSVQSNSYTHGGHTDTTTEDVRTERAKNAPFESSTFYNNTETTTGGDQNSSGVIQPHTTREIYEQKSDTEQIGGYTDNVAHTEAAATDNETIGSRSDSGTHTEAAFTDTMTRLFTRHGNIGVLSSGELMERDLKWWQAFGWLFDTAHDISNLITEGVLCL